MLSCFLLHFSLVIFFRLFSFFLFLFLILDILCFSNSVTVSCVLSFILFFTCDLAGLGRESLFLSLSVFLFSFVFLFFFFVLCFFFSLVSFSFSFFLFPPFFSRFYFLIFFQIFFLFLFCFSSFPLFLSFPLYLSFGVASSLSTTGFSLVNKCNALYMILNQAVVVFVRFAYILFAQRRLL